MPLQCIRGHTPFAGPVIQMRCKTKVPDTCSHDRFHSKLEQKIGDCPSIQAGFTDKWMQWKMQNDRWAWLCLPGACCTRLLCAPHSRRGVPQSHTWQCHTSRCSQALCEQTGSTMQLRRELGFFYWWKRMNSIFWAWRAVAIFMESRMKAFCS